MAFMGCTGLTSIVIPSSVTDLAWGAFSECTGVESLQFMGRVKCDLDWMVSSILMTQVSESYYEREGKLTKILVPTGLGEFYKKQMQREGVTEGEKKAQEEYLGFILEM